MKAKTLDEFLEILEERLENFEMTESDYLEAYQEYCEDLETDCSHTVSGYQETPMSFEAFFEDLDKEEDPKYIAILDLIEAVKKQMETEL